MTSEDSRLAIKHEGDIVCVDFIDRNILEEASIQAISAQITQLIEASSNPKLLLCFKNVQHLSSAALGALITINNQVREKEGQLRLSDINPQVHEIFLITKLDTLFQIHPNAQQALQSFR